MLIYCYVYAHLLLHILLIYYYLCYSSTTMNILIYYYIYYSSTTTYFTHLLLYILLTYYYVYTHPLLHILLHYSSTTMDATAEREMRLRQLERAHATLRIAGRYCPRSLPIITAYANLLSLSDRYADGC
jgi:hypothetical protein